MQSLFKQISTACESWLHAKHVGKEMNNQDATLNITQIVLKYLLKFLSVLILILHSCQIFVLLSGLNTLFYKLRQH